MKTNTSISHLTGKEQHTFRFIEKRIIEHLRSYPQYLSHEQIADPFRFVNSLIHEYDLTYIRKTIASWLTSIYKAKSWKKDSPGNLLYFYENLIKLIEAAWLIQQMDNSNRLANLSLTQDMENIQLMNIDLYCKPIHKDYPWGFFPRSLSEKEFINPYKVFSKFFQFRTLAKWKKELHNALHLSLSNNNTDELGEVIDILKIEKLLYKLVDASHLISVREFEWSEDQLISKSNNPATNEKETLAEGV